MLKYFSNVCFSDSTQLLAATKLVSVGHFCRENIGKHFLLVYESLETPGSLCCPTLSKSSFKVVLNGSSTL